MDDLERIEAIYQRATDKAVCVRDDEDGTDVWLPLSMCSFVPKDAERGEIVTVSAPEWLLIDRGLA